MTPDPGPPGRISLPSAHRDAAPLTQEPEALERGVPASYPETDEPGRGPRYHRPWSARRTTAALIAAVILAAAIAALVDVIAVRAGRPAASW